MSISVQVSVLPAQLWPQGDARDPLGIWGGRISVTEDATGGDVKVQFQVPQERRAAHVYTVYAAQVSQTSGTFQAGNVSARILGNWPNVDPQAGTQGFSTLIGRSMTDIGTTAPFACPDDPLIDPLGRFILLYDPRPGIASPMDILELKLQVNTNTLVYSFEAWGFFWDRAVMDAPGGPRHPGSS